MATHFSIPALEVSWTEEPYCQQSIWSQRVPHGFDWRKHAGAAYSPDQSAGTASLHVATHLESALGHRAEMSGEAIFHETLSLKDC